MNFGAFKAMLEAFARINGVLLFAAAPIPQAAAHTFVGYTMPVLRCENDWPLLVLRRSKLLGRRECLRLRRPGAHNVTTGGYLCTQKSVPCACVARALLHWLALDLARCIETDMILFAFWARETLFQEKYIRARNTGIMMKTVQLIVALYIGACLARIFSEPKSTPFSSMLSSGTSSGRGEKTGISASKAKDDKEDDEEDEKKEKKDKGKKDKESSKGISEGDEKPDKKKGKGKKDDKSKKDESSDKKKDDEKKDDEKKGGKCKKKGGKCDKEKDKKESDKKGSKGSESLVKNLLIDDVEAKDSSMLNNSEEKADSDIGPRGSLRGSTEKDDESSE